MFPETGRLTAGKQEEGDFQCFIWNSTYYVCFELQGSFLPAKIHNSQTQLSDILEALPKVIYVPAWSDGSGIYCGSSASAQKEFCSSGSASESVTWDLEGLTDANVLVERPQPLAGINQHLTLRFTRR